MRGVGWGYGDHREGWVEDVEWKSQDIMAGQGEFEWFGKARYTIADADADISEDSGEKIREGWKIREEKRRYYQGN